MASVSASSSSSAPVAVDGGGPDPAVPSLPALPLSILLAPSPTQPAEVTACLSQHLTPPSATTQWMTRIATALGHAMLRAASDDGGADEPRLPASFPLLQKCALQPMNYVPSISAQTAAHWLEQFNDEISAQTIAAGYPYPIPFEHSEAFGLALRVAVHRLLASLAHHTFAGTSRCADVAKRLVDKPGIYAEWRDVILALHVGPFVSAADREAVAKAASDAAAAAARGIFAPLPAPAPSRAHHPHPLGDGAEFLLRSALAADHCGTGERLRLLNEGHSWWTLPGLVTRFLEGKLPLADPRSIAGAFRLPSLRNHVFYASEGHLTMSTLSPISGPDSAHSFCVSMHEFGCEINLVSLAPRRRSALPASAEKEEKRDGDDISDSNDSDEGDEDWRPLWGVAELLCPKWTTPLQSAASVLGGGIRCALRGTVLARLVCLNPSKEALHPTAAGDVAQPRSALRLTEDGQAWIAGSVERGEAKRRQRRSGASPAAPSDVASDDAPLALSDLAALALNEPGASSAAALAPAAVNAEDLRDRSLRVRGLFAARLKELQAELAEAVYVPSAASGAASSAKQKGNSQPAPVLDPPSPYSLTSLIANVESESLEQLSNARNRAVQAQTAWQLTKARQGAEADHAKSAGELTAALDELERLLNDRLAESRVHLEIALIASLQFADFSSHPHTLYGASHPPQVLRHCLGTVIDAGVTAAGRRMPVDLLKLVLAYSGVSDVRLPAASVELATPGLSLQDAAKKRRDIVDRDYMLVNQRKDARRR